MSKILSRDEILKAQDIKTEEVQVPEWGGSILVRGLTGIERDRFEESILQGHGKNRTVTLDNIRAKLIARSVVDEQGNRIFSDADIEGLGKKSGATLSRVFEVCQRLSGLNEGALEELTKN